MLTNEALKFIYALANPVEYANLTPSGYYSLQGYSIFSSNKEKEYKHISKSTNVFQYLGYNSTAKQSCRIYYDSILRDTNYIDKEGNTLKILKNYIIGSKQFIRKDNYCLYNGVINNLEDAPITVKYLGEQFYVTLSTDTTAGSGAQFDLLMWYMELDEPITIQPGGSYSFNIKYKID